MSNTHWSHSQLSTWQGCGKRYELERVQRYPTPPAWYLVGGKAVHEATAWYDQDDNAPDTFVLARTALQEEIDLALEEWPDESEWLSARGNQRREYWEDKVVEHTQRWVDYRENNPQVIVEAVEEEVSYGEGSREIKAFLDRVLYDQELDERVIVDIKTSSRRPETTQQLGIYRALWNRAHPDKLVDRGFYFMTKDGGFHPKDPDLTMWDLDILDKLGDAWGRAKESKIYLPVLSSACETCSVRKACYVKSGDTLTTRMYDELNPRYGETEAHDQ